MKKITTVQKGRVISVTVYLNGTLQGGTVSILAGADLEDYWPTFRGVVSSSGDMWEKKAGVSWSTPAYTSHGWCPEGLIWTSTSGDSPEYLEEDEAVLDLLPKLYGTWVTKFIAKGGDLFSGVQRKWVRTIEDSGPESL